MCRHDRFAVKSVCVDDRNNYYLEGAGGAGIMVIVRVVIYHDPCYLFLSEQAAGYA